MDTLASCYFCGVAVEEPLSEFALVPEGRRDPGGDPTKVTLCPGCTRKLETVLTEFEASLPSSDRPAGDSGQDRAAAEETAGAGESVEPNPEEDVLFDPVDGSDLSIDDGTVDADPTAEDPTEDSAADASDTDTDTEQDSSEASTTEDPPSGSAPETGPDADEPSQSSESSVPGESDDAETTPADVESAADELNGDDGPSMTALEYNKVMRLIQNREFPVDRQEIVTVASSAYELSVEECETVLDVAVERGLLAESNGQLRRAD